MAGDALQLADRRVLLLGAGRMAGAWLASLGRAGVRTRVWARRPDRGAELAGRAPGEARFEPDLVHAVARADVLVFCVSDRSIDALAREVACAEPAGGARGPARAALHTSGYFGPEVLAPLAARGWSTATLHPLVALPPRPRADAPPPLERAAFTIDGALAARAVAEQMVAAAEGQLLPLRPEAERARYHASAALLSNGLVGLFDLAWEALASEATDDEAARAALLVLLASTVENLAAAKPAEALTGPVARGDAPVVAGHLDALGPEARSAYASLAQRMIRLAGATGRLAPDARRAVEVLLRTRGAP